jgi:hypothetical protein
MSVARDVTIERIEQGPAIQDYLRGMTKNPEQAEENYRHFRLTEDERAFLENIGIPMRVLVLAEDWCGDAVRYIPVMARMAEAAGNWDVRVLYRDQNPDLAGRWLKDGGFRAIPVFVFYDMDGNELTYFIEKPPAVYGLEERARAAFAAMHSDLPDAALPSGEMSESTLGLFAPYMRAFRQHHQTEWQHMFVDEIRRKLEEALSRQQVA